MPCPLGSEQNSARVCVIFLAEDMGIASCLQPTCLKPLLECLDEAATYNRMLNVIWCLQLPRPMLPLLPTALPVAPQPLLQHQLATLWFVSACSTPPSPVMQQPAPQQLPQQLPLLRLMPLLPAMSSQAPFATLSPPQQPLRPLPRPLPQPRVATA